MPSVTTRDTIMDIAERLVMTRGYNAFSYQDIAAEIGIKTASVHYHFAGKLALGVAVVRRYTAGVVALQQRLDADHVSTEPDKLKQYVGLFMRVSKTGTEICLCGALAAELASLPDELQQEVVAFFDVHEQWLARLLQSGRKRGHFEFTGSAKQMAGLMFSALEGALLVARGRRDPACFNAAVATLNRLIAPRSAA